MGLRNQTLIYFMFTTPSPSSIPGISHPRSTGWRWCVWHNLIMRSLTILSSVRLSHSELKCKSFYIPTVYWSLYPSGPHPLLFRTTESLKKISNLLLHNTFVFRSLLQLMYLVQQLGPYLVRSPQLLLPTTYNKLCCMYCSVFPFFVYLYFLSLF